MHGETSLKRHFERFVLARGRASLNLGLINVTGHGGSYFPKQTVKFIWRPFRDQFNFAIGKVFHVARDAKLLCDPPDRVTKAYALHMPPINYMAGFEILTHDPID